MGGDAMSWQDFADDARAKLEKRLLNHDEEFVRTSIAMFGVPSVAVERLARAMEEKAKK